MGNYHFSKVLAEHFLVRTSPHSHQIGKWLVSINLEHAMWPGRCSQMCVVDDFGNLVAVPA